MNALCLLFPSYSHMELLGNVMLIFEATSFPFTNPVDVLASINTLEVFQFSVLEGGP